MLPALRQEFIARAVPVLAADPRLVGVATAAAYTTGTMDEYFDLDLVIAVMDRGPVLGMGALRRREARRCSPRATVRTDSSVITVRRGC